MEAEQLTFITPVSSMPQVDWKEKSSSDSKSSATVSGRDQKAEKEKEYRLFKDAFKVRSAEYQVAITRIKNQISEQKTSLSQKEEAWEKSMKSLAEYSSNYRYAETEKYQKLKEQVDRDKAEIDHLKEIVKQMETLKMETEQLYQTEKLLFEQECFRYETEIAAFPEK